MSEQVKTHRSLKSIRRARKLQPQLVEPPKTILLMKGTKSSPDVSLFLSDMKKLRKQRSVLLGKKHEIIAWEDHTSLQKYCKKSACSLFVVGSHSKKRPNNIIIGRTYEHKILDMQELYLQSYEPMSTNISIPTHLQPFVIFQGDLWTTDPVYAALRTLLHDFYYAGANTNAVTHGNSAQPKNTNNFCDIDNVMRVVVSWSVLEGGKIYMRVYEVKMAGGKALLDEEGDGKISIEEMGPHAVFSLRRTSLADAQIWKKATHKPKPKVKKEKKNIKYDSLGNKRGKLYVDHQDLAKLPIRKRKLITKAAKPDRADKQSKKQLISARDPQLQERKRKNQDQFA